MALTVGICERVAQKNHVSYFSKCHVILSFFGLSSLML